MKFLAIDHFILKTITCTSKSISNVLIDENKAYRAVHFHSNFISQSNSV